MAQSRGYIYALGADKEPYVTIGSTTTSVAKRMKTLQTGVPYKLILLASVPVETDLRRIERHVRGLVNAVRGHLTGEWFNGSMTEGELIAFVEQAIGAIS